MTKPEHPAHLIPAINRAVIAFRQTGGDLPNAIAQTQRHYGTTPEIRLPHQSETVTAIQNGRTIIVFGHTGVYPDVLDSISAINYLLELAGPERPKTHIIIDARVTKILDPRKESSDHFIEVAGVSRFGTASPSENISVLKQAASALKQGDNLIIAPDGAKKHWNEGLGRLVKLVGEAMVVFAFTKTTTNLNALCYFPLFGRLIYTPLFARKGRITFSEPVSAQKIVGTMEIAFHNWGARLDQNPEALFMDKSSF